MEKQIKEEAEDTSLILQTSKDNLASLTLLERYDHYLQNESSDFESDGEFYLDDTMIREEYAQLRIDTAKYTGTGSKNFLLSTELPSRRRSSGKKEPSSADETLNGTVIEESGLGAKRTEDEQSELTGLKKLIENLGVIRKCGEEGNSIFCTESELELLQDRYGAILDYIKEISKNFEPTSSPKDNQQEDDEDEEVDVQTGREADSINTSSQQNGDDYKLLADKMESVQLARDRFYEVEQQVREQLEQLELVERYKMESVG